MKKLSTKLTPAIKQWIRETHGSDYYDDLDGMFHYPSLWDGDDYSCGKHIMENCSDRYTEVSESEFLAEFGNPKPKKGDLVLVRDRDSEDWLERIFLTEFERSKYPYIAVYYGEECLFKNGEKYNIQAWVQMKPIETITKEEAEKILKKRIV